jgi:hypothetical protein
MKTTLTCLKCGEPANPASVKKSFLLFPKFKCGSCNSDNIYPASTGIQILHWILASIFVLIFLAGLAAGQVMLPGAVFISGFWGIFANMRIRHEHQKNKKNK